MLLQNNNHGHRKKELFHSYAIVALIYPLSATEHGICEKSKSCTRCGILRVFVQEYSFYGYDVDQITKFHDTVRVVSTLCYSKDVKNIIPS